MGEEATLVPPSPLTSGRESPAAAAAVRGSVIKLTAESLGRLLGLVTTLLLTRELGVSAFGLFAALSGIAVLVAEVANAGLLAAVPRELVVGGLSLASMARAKLLLSAATIAAGLVLSLASPLLLPLVVYFVLAGWTEFFGAAVRTLGWPLREAGFILGLRAVTLCLAWIALALGGGAYETAWGFAGAGLVAVALALPFTRGLFARGAGGSGTSAAGVIRNCLPLGLNGALALISLRVETLALLAVRSVQEVGFFAAALRLVEPLLSVPSAIAAGAMPALTREAVAGGREVRDRTVVVTALLAAPVATGLALVAPYLVPLLGEGYAGAVPPLRILAVALFALFLNALLMHALIAAGRASLLPRLTAARIVVALGAALVLVPTLGATGGAIGFLASELVLLALASRACAQSNFAIATLRPAALALGVTVPMAVAVLLTPAGLAGLVTAGVVTYGATLALVWRLKPRMIGA